MSCWWEADIWGWLRLGELLHSIWASALTLLTIAVGVSGSVMVRCIRGCADLCGQNCSLMPDQISNHRVVGSNPGSAIPSWLRERTVLGSIGEVRYLPWLYATAKPAVSEACLGSMSSHSPLLATSNKKKTNAIMQKSKFDYLFHKVCNLYICFIRPMSRRQWFKRKKPGRDHPFS